MKTYLRHNCTRNHRSYATLAKCMFPRAAWVIGTGNYACLAWCDVLTVSLWPTEEGALSAKEGIDWLRCGHACARRHEVVKLINPLDPPPAQTPGGIHADHHLPVSGPAPEPVHSGGSRPGRADSALHPAPRLGPATAHVPDGGDA